MKGGALHPVAVFWENRAFWNYREGCKKRSSASGGPRNPPMVRDRLPLVSLANGELVELGHSAEVWTCMN